MHTVHSGKAGESVHLIFGTADDGGEHCSWKILVCKASLHQTGARVQHDGRLIITHLTHNREQTQPSITETHIIDTLL